MRILEEQAKDYNDSLNKSMVLLFTAEVGPFFIVFSTLARFMMDPLYRAIILSGFHSYKLKWIHVPMLMLFIIFIIFIVVLAV